MADVDLNTIVQRMMDAGESKDNIKSVITEYNARNPKQNISKIDSSEPGTFWGGVGKSLSSGEAANAGMQGAIGFGKGAIADLPEGMVNMAKDAFHTVNPYDQFMGAVQGAKNIYNDPLNPRNYIPGYDTAKNMWDTTTKAGADPESFGRMMGQTTGQPAVLGAAGEFGAPRVGPALEKTGSMMRRYQPISGFVPRFAELRTMRNLESGVGRGIENIGRRLQIPTKMGEVMPHSPSWSEGELLHEPPGTSMTGPFKQGDVVPPKQTTGVPTRGSMPVNMPQSLPEFSGNRLPPATSPTTDIFATNPPKLQIEGPTPMDAPATKIGTASPQPAAKPRVSMKSGMAFEVPQEQITRDFLKKAKSQGFDFKELTPGGNFRFEKGS
jgi:hypothetical protein